jgi:hypothetical protein
MARNCNPLPAIWARSRLQRRQNTPPDPRYMLARFLSGEGAIHGGSGIR